MKNISLLIAFFLTLNTLNARRDMGANKAVGDTPTPTAGCVSAVAKATLELGLNANLIIIGLGLFFMILSEVFTIAKSAKQENDLTI